MIYINYQTARNVRHVPSSSTRRAVALFRRDNVSYYLLGHAIKCNGETLYIVPVSECEH